MKNFFSNLSKCFIMILKIIVLLFIIIFILGTNFVVLSISKDNITWQIGLYTLISIFIAPLTFYLLFIKANFKTKAMLSLFFLIWLMLPRIMPDVMKAINIDSCLDLGGRWNYEKGYCETNKDKIIP